MSAIAVVNFTVHGITSYGYSADNIPVHMELQKYCGFEYGNGTCVFINIAGHDNMIDTRYDKTIRRDGSNFDEWAYDYLTDCVDSNLTVTKV